MRLIPAIDIIDGQCVRLTQGDYKEKKVYSKSPIDVAREIESMGYEYLHLVDLQGAKGRHPHNLFVLNQLALETNLKIDFGGGVKSEDSLVQVLRSGANQVNIGSLAVRNPNLVKFWLMRYSPEQIIIGADVKDGRISVNGWQETSDYNLLEFINSFVDAGAKYFVCTDVSKDGMMEGTALKMYDTILENFPDIFLIASGGVSSIKEIKILEEMGVKGVIIGKAYYEGLIDLIELRKAFS